jgi:hypothetical protein
MLRPNVDNMGACPTVVREKDEAVVATVVIVVIDAVVIHVVQVGESSNSIGLYSLFGGNTEYLLMKD